MATRGSTSPTRRRILDAGIDLWGTLPVTELLAGYSVSSVAKAAGVTRATFYSYWPSTEEYLDDLLEHLLEVAPGGFDPAVGDIINRLTAVGTDVVDHLMEGSTRQLEHLATDPAVQLRYGFLTRYDDPVVADKLRQQYRAIDDERIAIFHEIMGRWGRVPRQPLTWESFTRTFTISMEAFALHHKLDPDTVPAELYGLVSVVLNLLLTARADDHRGVLDLAAPANTWPAQGLRMRRAREGQGPPLPPLELQGDPQRITRAIIDATERLLGDEGWAELTLTSIATAADTTERELLALFGSKPGLAAALFMERYGARVAALAPSDDPVADLRAHLALSREELSRSPALTQSVLLVFVGVATAPRPGLVSGDPLPLLRDDVARAQTRGLLRTDLDARVIAEMLRRAQLTEVAPVPWSAEPATDVVELILTGLRPGAEAALDDTTGAGGEVDATT